MPEKMIGALTERQPIQSGRRFGAERSMQLHAPGKRDLGIGAVRIPCMRNRGAAGMAVLRVGLPALLVVGVAALGIAADHAGSPATGPSRGQAATVRTGGFLAFTQTPRRPGNLLERAGVAGQSMAG